MNLLVNSPIHRGGHNIVSALVDLPKSFDAGSQHVLVCDGARERVEVLHKLSGPDPSPSVYILFKKLR